LLENFHINEIQFLTSFEMEKFIAQTENRKVIFFSCYTGRNWQEKCKDYGLTVNINIYYLYGLSQSHERYNFLLVVR
jgi:hypothetical protein